LRLRLRRLLLLLLLHLLQLLHLPLRLVDDTHVLIA
jgi:hypothetical protein